MHHNDPAAVGSQSHSLSDGEREREHLIKCRRTEAEEYAIPPSQKMLCIKAHNIQPIRRVRAGRHSGAPAHTPRANLSVRQYAPAHASLDGVATKKMWTQTHTQALLAFCINKNMEEGAGNTLAVEVK